MTNSEFQSAIAHNLGEGWVSVGFAPGSCDCCPDEEDENVGDEGGFSWHACDSCGSRLGGDRYSAHLMVDRFSEPIHLGICPDCVQFHANGELPNPLED